VIFWLFAKQNVQIPNISERQQYQKVMKKVVFTDIEEGLTVTSEVPEVFLELSGPFWEMTQNQEQIMVVASLKNRRAGRHSIDVSARVPENVNIIQYYPETIDVRLESLTTKKLELQNLNLGNLPPRKGAAEPLHYTHGGCGLRAGFLAGNSAERYGHP